MKEKMESSFKLPMSCERVEEIVLDLEHQNAADAAERAAALAHLMHCPQCAALQESWQAAKEELHALGEETMEARAPARVEMRLRQEFRAARRSTMVRRGVVTIAWTLAAAAVLFGAINLRNWQHSRHDSANNSNPSQLGTQSAPEDAANLSADLAPLDSSGEFTLLPGSTFDANDENSILRVRMQRGSLAALGLPVNEQTAGEWIQVDLLVGNDGLPQAVRLAQEQEED